MPIEPKDTVDELASLLGGSGGGPWAEITCPSSELFSVSDMVDNVRCSDGSWLLVGETGSSSCIGGHMINLGPPRSFERLSCDDTAATSL